MFSTAIRASVLAFALTGVAAAQAPSPPPAQPAQPPAANRGFQPDTTPPAEFATLKPVPHGEVRIVWYDSKVLGAQRRMHVWTPPGYDQGRTSYPVLYLIHGGGQNDSAWTEGFAPYVLDNLLASGAIKPMIVVMPNGAVPGGGGPGGGPTNTPEAIAARAKGANEAREKFINSLLTDTIPYVEKAYRAKKDRNSRAIAGFSYGGAEALWATTEHLDMFAWTGVFSMGVQGGSTAGAGSIAGSGSSGSPAEFVQANASFFADPAKTNRQIKLFWIGVGSDDGVVGNGPKQLADTLTAKGINHEYHLTDGGHSMTNWRAYLRDFASKLFR